MLDLRALRADPATARAALARRGSEAELDRLLELDEVWRKLQGTVDELRATRNGHRFHLGLEACGIGMPHSQRRPYRSPAGYFAHSTTRDAGRSYDPSYEGITLRFTSWAGMASYADPDYAPLREKLAQQIKLKVYQTLPEPDGRYFGPSHFANATNAPAPMDQWSNRARDYGLAMLTDEGKPLAFTKRTPSSVNVGFPSETTMRTQLRAAAVNMSRATTGPQFATAAAWLAKAWYPTVWSETLKLAMSLIDSCISPSDSFEMRLARFWARS